MKKKRIANAIMVLIIVAILAGGVLGVGHIRGWFDTADGSTAVLTQRSGTVYLERGGVRYSVTEDTVLRQGDQISTLAGVTAVIAMGEDTVTLGGSVSLTVENPAADAPAFRVSDGEIFVNTENPVKLTFELGSVSVEHATAALSVRSGAQTVSVFRGQVDNASAGQATEYVGEEITVRTMRLEGLNDFYTSQIRKFGSMVTLCFTGKDLDDLAAKRQQALEDLINGAQDPTEHEHVFDVEMVASSCTEPGYTRHTCTCGETYTDHEMPALGHSFGPWKTIREATAEESGLMERICTACGEKEEKTVAPLTPDHVHSFAQEVIAPTCTEPGYTLYTCDCGYSYTDNATSATGHHYHTRVVAPTCTAKGYTLHTCDCGNAYTDGIVDALGHRWNQWVTVKEATQTEDGLQERTCQDCDEHGTRTISALSADAAGYVYINIVCDTILNNMGDLTSGKEEFVPADGVILPMVKVPFYKDETVFEVLKRVCEKTNLQIEYSWTPLYGSYYIEGINHLYEFDCGIESGWMYKVNEWFPNYGCSEYVLDDGDVIVWCYTCKGLGADVGDVWMG